MKQNLVPGDAVEALIYWAHGSDPVWMKSYQLVRFATKDDRVEPGRVLVRYIKPGPLSGAEFWLGPERVRRVERDASK